MDDAPACAIRIDKEGIWYYGDKEISRKEVVFFFYKNLTRDQKGRYLIELENERCYVEVEDTPFVVRSAQKMVSEGKNHEIICLALSDGTSERLDPATLLVGRENVLYCTIKSGVFSARFSRAAYYQIADYIEYDVTRDAYFIPLNGQSFYIQNSLDN
jgi:hypothetical protein